MKDRIVAVYKGKGKFVHLFEEVSTDLSSPPLVFQLLPKEIHPSLREGLQAGVMYWITANGDYFFCEQKVIESP